MTMTKMTSLILIWRR